MWRTTLERLPGAVILGAGVAVFALCLWLGTQGNTVTGPPLVLFGAGTLVGSIVWLAVRASRHDEAALRADPELAFAWSVHTDGPRVLWRRKAGQRTASLTRLVLAEAWLYAFFTLLISAAYALIAWNIIRTGGLRRSDLPTAIPFLIVALGIYAAIVRFAVNAFRHQVATEIVADRQRMLLSVTGVRPLSGGAITVTIPMASVIRVAERAFTYRYVTTVTITLHLVDGSSRLLARLSPADWERIASDLMPLVGSARD